MPSTDRVPRVHRAWVRAVGFVLDAYFTVYHHLQVEGLEQISCRGPLLITTNHVSALDYFAQLMVAIRLDILPGVDVFTPGKKELLSAPVLGTFFRSLGMFPLDRGNIDITAMRSMLKVLKEGHVLGLAPEGTRSPTGQLQAFQPVVAKIAIQQRVPILPLAVIGAEKALPLGSRFPRPRPVTLRLGAVYELSEFYGATLDQEGLQRAAAYVREQVALLLPEWMRVPPPVSAARPFSVRGGEQS